MNMKKIVLGLLFIGMTLSANVQAGEPGWDWRIVTFGENREKIQSTPITQREYRPLHVYGNTVRRMHYRGTPLPVPKVLAPNNQKG